MDSAPSSLSFATRDGSTAAAASVDDCALSDAAGLAKDAALLFQAGKTVECLRILNQLLLKKENDPKVRHNIAIAETFKDGCPDPRRLIEALENIQKQSDELAQSSGEHPDVTSNDGRKPLVGIKGTNNASRQISSSSVYSDMFDTSVAMFNTAVIWFHLHDYAKSFLYLDTLYQNIEAIDEGTTLRICLLLLDVALFSHHASISVDVITYMEKAFCGNSLISQLENGASAQQQSSVVLKSTSLPTNLSTTDSSHCDSVGAANTFENSLSDEALDEDSLQLLSSLDIGGKNLQRFSGIASSNDILSSQAEESLSVVDVKLMLRVYKVRLLLLTRNLKTAKREVKMAMNLARGKDYTLALYLKSQLEYARRNPRKAIKLLVASGNHMEIGISSMYYNNLGCIYYQLGKHHTSGVFFSKALNHCLLARKEKPPKLLTLSQDKSLLISYNCGMHSLACGKPYHAARCFQKSSLIFYNRPLLWLRIAECCLMALEKGLITSNSSASERSDIIVSVIGKGKWRHLALISGNSSKGQLELDSKDVFSYSGGKQTELSITLAWQCLVNALYLLDSSEAKHSTSGSSPRKELNELKEQVFTNHKKAEGGNHMGLNTPSVSIQVNSNSELKEQKSRNSHIASQPSLQNSLTEYEYICMKENHMMKQAILADLAYVELALGNPSIALTTSKTLLELPECCKMYIFLGTLYAAEALCLLNQPKEAAEHLMKYISSGNNVELPYTREDCEKWKVVDNDNSNCGPGRVTSHVVSSSDESQVSSVFSSPEEARGMVLANFAANFALLGDLEQAQHFVMKALSDVPKSTQAILTAIYLDLKRGKTQEALAKLKQHEAVRLLPWQL